MSGTYNYVPVLDDLLTEAWERCGKNPADLTGAVARSARRSVYLTLIDWTNRGLNLWQVDSGTVSLIPGSVTYTLPAATVDLLDVWLTDTTGTDLLMNPIGRTEYSAIPNKTQPGRPTQYWVDRILPLPTITVYQSPDVIYTLHYNRMRQPQDVSGLSQQADMPILWGEALASELARRLAVKYAPDRLPVLAPDAAAAYANASGEDRERVPLRVVPQLGW